MVGVNRDKVEAGRDSTNCLKLLRHSAGKEPLTTSENSRVICIILLLAMFRTEPLWRLKPDLALFVWVLTL